MVRQCLFMTAALAAGLLVTASPAQAQSWVGASAGSAESDEFCELFGPGVRCDDDDTGIKAFIGLQPVPQLGLEAFWVDLGEVTAMDNFGDRLGISADGIGVALLPTIPVSPDFDLYARFGLFAWEVDADLQTPGGRARGSDDGSDPVYGLGGRLFVTETFGLRVEWEQYELDDEDVSLFSLGAELRF
jgi:hypothetical protein